MLKDWRSRIGHHRKTDIAGLAVLMVFFRYVFLQSFLEGPSSLQTTANQHIGSEIFNILDEFFSSNEIPWENCAYAMMGHNDGVIPKSKAKAKNCSSSHCVLHRHALASRKMPSELMVFLNDAIKIIKYI
ncbi:hypothetical protein PR048_013152 [Dryococelus australis]|uniref:Zinc finger BED domain-containing protein 5 n=1 Tax=Dryococelus australis TaxID=614101 RepID=A0ABQ9HRC5_9NEOP|nr:hypothetical protein PR048_013152 [Dryococelus australis]